MHPQARWPRSLSSAGAFFGAKLPELVKRRSTSREDCRFRSVIAAWTIEDNGSCFIVKDHNGRSRSIIPQEGRVVSRQTANHFGEEPTP